jgi:hypothetical protein
MRLLAEIQMSLHAVTHRTGQPSREGKPDISGLWLWGETALPALLPVDLPSVVTRNPFLQSLQVECKEEHGAEIIISEVERLSEVLPSEALPKTVVLTGAGHAVCLHQSLLPRFTKDWQAKSPATEAGLFAHINRMLDAA